MAQELFPQSYAQTAAWLQRERMANTDTLARCQAALQGALASHPPLQALAAGCQVCLPHVPKSEFIPKPSRPRCRVRWRRTRRCRRWPWAARSAMHMFLTFI